MNSNNSHNLANNPAESSQPSSLNAQPKNPQLNGSDLPPVLQLYYEAAPESFRLPAILTALTCLCALGTRLRAKYVYDI